jgi:enoyl-CoA hydratase/carnithine racemase
VSELEVVQRGPVLWVRATASVPGGQRLASELADVCLSVGKRDSELACIALASEEGPFFITTPTAASECDTDVDLWRDVIRVLAQVEPPTVAVLGGDAIGPAWELALACDLRVASTAVRVGSPEIRWGRLPSAGGSQRLVRTVGPTAAMRLLLLGEILSADEALELGLLHRVVDPPELQRPPRRSPSPIRRRRRGAARTCP